MNTQLVVQVEPELNEQIGRLARAEGKSASEIAHDLLADYVRQRDMAAHLDGLWARIRSQLPSRAQDPEYLQQIIRQARKGE